MAGFARGKAGVHARAAALLRPAFLADPRDRYVRNAFLSACRKAGDLAALRAALDEALAAHPDADFLHGVRRKWMREGDEAGG
jgi:hypothetical protein